MLDLESPDPEAPAPDPAGSIVITAAGSGSADLTIRAEGMTAGQLYAAAFHLDALAHEVRAGQIAKAALGGIIPAPADILAQLRAIGRT